MRLLSVHLQGNNNVEKSSRRLVLLKAHLIFNRSSPLCAQNKQQRKAVRDAVLRTKDVAQMLEEIEEIEKLQMTSVSSEPVVNDKGLEEKKAKLHSSVHRVAAFYVSTRVCVCLSSNLPLTARRRPQKSSRN